MTAMTEMLFHLYRRIGKLHLWLSRKDSLCPGDEARLRDSWEEIESLFFELRERIIK